MNKKISYKAARLLKDAGYWKSTNIFHMSTYESISLYKSESELLNIYYSIGLTAGRKILAQELVIIPTVKEAFLWLEEYLNTVISIVWLASAEPNDIFKYMVIVKNTETEEVTTRYYAEHGIIANDVIDEIVSKYVGKN